MLLLWMLVEELLILVAPPRMKIVDGAEKALARVVREKIAIRAR